MGNGYEIIDHTADSAIRVWGRDYEELVRQAARGMIAVMVDTEGLQASKTARVHAEAPDREILLHHLLAELLHLVEDDGLVPVGVSEVDVEGTSGAVEVDVLDLEQARDRLLGVLKAVTYHGLDIRETGSGVETVITFDM